MNNEHIAKRAQDVQSGLRDVQDKLVTATIPVTRQIGMAALLAVHIRGLDVIENIVGFHGFCESLGIPSDTVPLVLSALEATGWLRVAPNAFNPRRIEESIPYFQEVYEALGDQWNHRSPSEVELATMALLERLSAGPEPEGTATSSLGISPQELETVVDIGELGGYLRRYTSPLEKISILYAPQFVDENPESLLNLIAKKGDNHEQVRRVLRAAQARPGVPVLDLQRADPLVAELVNSNVLSAPAIVSSTGEHSFAFAPYRTNKPRPLLDKARIILACVRYGEHFSSITKVQSPRWILENLRDKKMIGKTPHSNIGTQYAAAANMGVGFIERVVGRYRFRLYETEDNLAAVDLAILMCSGATEDDVHTLMPPEEVRQRISTPGPVGGLVLPESNRGRARSGLRHRALDRQTQTAVRLGRDLIDDLRGVHRVLR
jgi:hypothetical protein